MLQVQGKTVANEIFNCSNLFHSVVVDEAYMVIGKHIEENIRRRIQEGEFVNFARLLPRNRVMALNENRLEIINNNGKPEWRTASDLETIGNFYKWEQTFRMFSTVYTDKFPDKVKQLL